MAAERPTSMERLKSLSDSMIPVPRPLDEEIDIAISSHSPSMAVDVQTGIIVRAKAPAEVLFGYLPGETKGMSVHKLVHQDDRESHKTWLAQYQTDNPRLPLRNSQVYGLHKDGHSFPVEFSASVEQINSLRLAIVNVVLSTIRSGSRLLVELGS